MTPGQRPALFVEACNLARAVLMHRPDRDEVLSRQEPPPAAWRRLVSESRGA